jgi:kynurenine formamidase
MMTPTQPAAIREAQSVWWPSKYGADDQAGALNEITPGKVLEAIGLVRQGRVYGTNRLGIDTLPQVVTRGLLLDMAAARERERLQPGEVITVSDVEAALAADGLDVRPGDAVFFCTGWGEQWGTDNDRYASGEPGPGLALATWLADHRVALTGCDTWSYGPYPPEDPDAPFAVPQLLNTRHGVVVVENLHLAEAARDHVHEFLLVISHAKLRGATGAWVAPLAIA